MKVFKEKVIKYDVESEWLPGIVSAKQEIPDWYKKIPSVDLKNIKVLPYKLNVKNCVPFLDSLTSGYCGLIPTDIGVEKNEENFNLSWKSEIADDVVGVRGDEAAPGFMPPPGYSKHHFTWRTTFAIELPKGYSCLLTHPLNRFELPFYTLSAIVDADSGLYSGNIPFFIKEGFEGIIKADTPFVQIIPFKREDWKLKKENGLYNKCKIKQYDMGRFTYGAYKKNNWKKKNYN